jgi:MbtH protein
MTSDAQFKIVINLEEQYSVIPTSWPVPHGWREVGITGSREVCCRHVEEHWTDMRPASLRRAMDGE